MRIFYLKALQKTCNMHALFAVTWVVPSVMRVTLMTRPQLSHRQQVRIIGLTGKNKLIYCTVSVFNVL